MKIKEFRQAGHSPTLFSAFLYFDVSFMVWVLLGALGVFIAQDFALSASQICQDLFGFYGAEFLVFGLAALGALLSLLTIQQVWRDSWAGDRASAVLVGAEQ